ncbi:MAG TPA: bifunctional phosphoribosyl-AMP cyclohydrolase/phosphoribosyl-ATP diphosphatase HisIE [Gemmatimonadales bacterium]|nr:bifunctional phosphoribosyl-AMP cyclohydrolase/phosphoribosyl-ATP diphosphatase HisIE [Gemmatimonadales bacterium]
MPAFPALDELQYGPDGLVPVIAQDVRTGDVLMLAWANRDALEHTLSSGEGHYWSRSRQRLWRKGETSGHTQQVVEVRLDCDRDTVLYRVRQTGPACHTGARTCFVSRVEKDGGLRMGPDGGGHLLERLRHTIAARAAERPEGSYTVTLLDKGPAKASQKVGEEAVEVVVAANAETPERLASESADLFYHLLVLLESKGVTLDAVWDELERRAR